jgi:hypothetical protein
MDWGCGSSGRVPALQACNLAFITMVPLKKVGKKEGRKEKEI